MAHQTAKSLKNKALDDLNAGKLPQALKKALLGVKKFPKDPDYHAIAGFVLTEQRQYRKSIPHFAAAAKQKPNDPQFAENLANALLQTGQLLQALSFAERKLEQFPGNTELARVVDEIELKGKNWREVIANASDRLNTRPDDANVLAIRSRAYERIGFEQHSTDDIQRAYALDPTSEAVAFQMARNLHHAGDKSGCIRILRDILKTSPGHEASLLQLSSVAPKEQASEWLKQVEDAITGLGHASDKLEFAKAQLIMLQDGLETALPQFARANAMQQAGNPYVAADEENKLDRICQLFPDASTLAKSGHSTAPVPIFVIGQPRSGTTLMEMMLSAGPDIAGCGELALGIDLSLPYIDDGKDFGEAEAREYAQEFIRLMPPISDGSVAFVDKMPHNYQLVGFLLSAFPNAKVINMLRDPRDVGLSKWIRRFPVGGMRYASDLAAIAHSANLYRRYMSHWNDLFGDRILTVSYENLVQDPEAHSRSVAAFCGIEWHDRMTRPEKNTKRVRTASVDQVREGISARSVGGWRAVADHIQPMLAGFDPNLWPEYDWD